MTSRLKLSLITGAAALAVSAIAVPAAQADDYSCTFTGATGNIGAVNAGNPPDVPEVGVESILTDDAQANEGDGAAPAARLNDTDNGNGHVRLNPVLGGAAAPIGAGTEDGSYDFSTAAPPATAGTATCLYLNTTPGPVTPGDGSGVYPAQISSHGEYDNTVCGSGTADDDDTDAPEQNPNADVATTDGTVVDLNPIGTVNSYDIVDAKYAIDFTAGQGQLDVISATQGAGGDGTLDDAAALEPDGVVTIDPTRTEGHLDGGAPGVACLTDQNAKNPNDPNDSISGNVVQFQASGAFVAGTSS